MIVGLGCNVELDAYAGEAGLEFDSTRRSSCRRDKRDLAELGVRVWHRQCRTARHDQNHLLRLDGHGD
jgi:hypothetical protein